MIDLSKGEAYKFKSYKKFEEFAKEHDANSKTKLVEFKNWRLTEEGLSVKKKVYPMRDSGMRTLLKTFEMPSHFYYSKSPTDMLIRDVNRMKKEYTSDSEIMVHIKNGQVRAVSRPNVKAVKLKDLFESINIGKKLFKSAIWSDYGLRLSISENDKEIKVAKDDIIDIGTEIRYSDVGAFSTSAIPFLLRLVCTNGMTLKEKSPLLNKFSMSAFSDLPDEKYLEKLKTNMAMVTTDSKGLKRVFKIMKNNPVESLASGKQLMKSMRSVIGADKFDENEKLTKKIMIDEKERRTVNTEIGLYDLLNIVTRMAKKYDFWGRMKLEQLAGKLVITSERELAKNE